MADERVPRLEALIRELTALGPRLEETRDTLAALARRQQEGPLTAAEELQLRVMQQEQAGQHHRLQECRQEFERLRAQGEPLPPGVLPFRPRWG